MSSLGCHWSNNISFVKWFYRGNKPEIDRKELSGRGHIRRLRTKTLYLLISKILKMWFKYLIFNHEKSQKNFLKISKNLQYCRKWAEITKILPIAWLKRFKVLIIGQNVSISIKNGRFSARRKSCIWNFMRKFVWQGHFVELLELTEGSKA